MINNQNENLLRLAINEGLQLCSGWKPDRRRENGRTGELKNRGKPTTTRGLHRRMENGRMENWKIFVKPTPRSGIDLHISHSLPTGLDYSWRPLKWGLGKQSSSFYSVPLPLSNNSSIYSTLSGLRLRNIFWARFHPDNKTPGLEANQHGYFGISAGW